MLTPRDRGAYLTETKPFGEVDAHARPALATPGCPDPDQPRLCAPALPIATLNKPRTQTRSHAPDRPTHRDDTRLLSSGLQHGIAQLDARIEHLRQQTRVPIDVNEPPQNTFDLLISVTGIADASVIQFLGALLLLPEEMQARRDAG